MNQNTPYYVQKLKEDFSQKQRRSPLYSLRAYARDMNLHAATLSMIFNGKRALPHRASLQVADKLALGPRERTLFLESLHHGKSGLDDIKINHDEERFMLDESYFHIISEWEHYAVMTLLDCNELDPRVEVIAQRLGIALNRTEVVVNNLLASGLLRKEEGRLVKSHGRIRTTEDVSSAALRRGHLETLEQGMEKLEQVPLDLRDYSSMMVALDPEKIPDVKKIIREFRQKLTALAKDGHRSEVYQLAIQFYPLTSIKEQ